MRVNVFVIIHFQSWTDCRLTWNTTDYNNISMIHVPYDMVWVPDIALYDSAAEEEMMAGKADYNAHVYSTGVVKYFFPAVVKTVCRINVRYFPFDTQHCSLKFGSWSFSGNSLDI